MGRPHWSLYLVGVTSLGGGALGVDLDGTYLDAYGQDGRGQVGGQGVASDGLVRVMCRGRGYMIHLLGGPVAAAPLLKH